LSGNQTYCLGVCNLCRNVKGVDVKQTQWHHEQYDDNNPERFILEICAKCHRVISSYQLSKERTSEIAKIARASLPNKIVSKAGKKGIRSRFEKYGKSRVLEEMASKRKLVYNRHTGRLQLKRGLQ
jgi:hypothetical protein